MIPFAEIVADYENGHEYLEYDGKFGEWEYTIILEHDTLIFSFKDFENFAEFAIDMEEVLEMDESEFHAMVHSGIYYSCLPF